MKALITTENFTRVKNDIYGNPRYVVHYLDIADTFADALRIAKAAIGGKTYRGREYGGMIVFQSYNTQRDADNLNEAINS